MSLQTLRHIALRLAQSQMPRQSGIKDALMYRTPSELAVSSERIHVKRRVRVRASRVRSALLAFAAVFLSTTLIGQPAWAHGGDPSAEGYVIVQQALSYLVNDSSPVGTENAMVKVDEALAADDQDGVDVAEVQEAKSALAAGDTVAARSLLQESIAEAVAELKPAVGEETGTTVVMPPFTQGPRELTDWVFLVLSILVALGGALLALLFRPREGMRELRRDILAADGAGDQSPRLTSTRGDHDAH